MDIGNHLLPSFIFCIRPWMVYSTDMYLCTISDRIAVLRYYLCKTAQRWTWAVVDSSWDQKATVGHLHSWHSNAASLPCIEISMTEKDLLYIVDNVNSNRHWNLISPDAVLRSPGSLLRSPGAVLRSPGSLLRSPDATLRFRPWHQDAQAGALRSLGRRLKLDSHGVLI